MSVNSILKSISFYSSDLVNRAGGIALGSALLYNTKAILNLCLTPVPSSYQSYPSYEFRLMLGKTSLYAIGVGIILYSGFKQAFNYLYRDASRVVNEVVKKLESYAEKERLVYYEIPNLKYLVEGLISRDCKKLFNLHEIKEPEAGPFNALVTQLDNPANMDEIRVCIYNAISKILELHAMQSGVCSDSYQHPQTHPFIQKLITVLALYQKSLLKQNPSTELRDKILNMIPILEQIKAEMKVITPGENPKPLEIDEDLLEDLKDEENLTLENIARIAGELKPLVSDLDAVCLEALKQCMDTQAKLKYSQAFSQSLSIQQSSILLEIDELPATEEECVQYAKAFDLLEIFTDNDDLKHLSLEQLYNAYKSLPTALEDVAVLAGYESYKELKEAISATRGDL